MNESALLTIRDVRKSFGANPALDGVSLDLRAGEVHALLGENGAGKSTLVKIIAGAERADSGTLTLAGVPYRPRGPREARKLGTAMIYQELTIAPHLSVEANIMLGRESTFAGVLRLDEHRRRAREALGMLGHADLPLDQIAGTLGIARLQIVEIARALVDEARIVVFDEPTSSLAEHDAERLFEVVRRLRDRGMAVVYISHFLEEVRRVADRFTILRDGRSVSTGSIAETSTSTIIARMIGRELNEMFPRPGPREPGGVLLELRSLSGRVLPKDASLTLRRGEILGIAGLVGAGRTELLRTIFGLDPVRSGEISIASNRSPRRATPRDRVREKVGFLSEDRKTEGLALARSIEDNLTYSSLDRYARFGWIDLKKRARESVSWLDALKVSTRDPKRAVRTLSGGNQQKIALGRLLHQDADLFLLDEPTRGIDVGSKAEIYRLLHDLAGRGKAILMVGSDATELLGVCDRVAVMSRGRLGPARPVEEWSEHTIMEKAGGASALEERPVGS